MTIPRFRCAVAGVATTALLLGSGMASASASTPGSTNAPQASDQQVTELIVAYAPGVNPSEAPGVATGSAEVSGADLQTGEAIGFGMRTVTLADAVDGATADALAAELSNTPGVLFAEPSHVVTIADTQDVSSWGGWGLDRIDQRGIVGGASIYDYGSTGSGVTAYVVDTGITPHADFTGRLNVAPDVGFDALVDGNGTQDCPAGTGHGTHVAGTLAGTTYGVAKAARLRSVRVLGCGGSGTSIDVVRGLDWIVANPPASGRSVVNLSLTAPEDAAIDLAIGRVVAAGFTVVVAAGNSNQDACLYSPARAPSAITVGASTSADLRAGYSNYGSCSDIYAPGDVITSAAIDGTSTQKSGTSMAAPHVAGVAARILERDPSLTPAQVAQVITSAATPKDFVSPSVDDPNLLLYAPTPPDAATVGTVTPGDESLAVTWTAPTPVDSAITSYTARAWNAPTNGTQAGSCQPTPVTGLSCTITGLPNGATYHVEVIASNVASAGDPAASRTSAALDPLAPRAPQSVTVTAADASAAVSWTAPTSDGGRSISSYTARAWTAPAGGVSAFKTCQPSPQTGLTCTLTGLANGTPYYVDVVAANAVGTGAAPASRVAVTPAAPAPPASGGGGGSSGGSSSGSTGGSDSTWLVKEVRPSAGPTAGGTTALIIGYGFTGATRVTVGGVTAPGFRFINDGTLEIVTPPGALGWQDLVVWLPNGSAPAGFQYSNEAPAVASTPATPTTPTTPATPTTPPSSAAGVPVGPASSPIVRPTTVLAAQTAVTAVGRAAGTPAGAPIVTGDTGDAFKLRVVGLPKSGTVTAQIRIGGKYYSLGKVRTTARGAAVLPAFSAQKPGTYLVKVAPTDGVARYVKVVVR